MLIVVDIFSVVVVVVATAAVDFFFSIPKFISHRPFIYCCFSFSLNFVYVFQLIDDLITHSSSSSFETV